MTFGGVTTVWAGDREALKLLEGVGSFREKQPVLPVVSTWPGQGIHLKIDLQELGGETKQAEQEKEKIKGILSTYSEQDLIQKFF